jgi:hypothetical protein
MPDDHTTGDPLGELTRHSASERLAELTSVGDVAREVMMAAALPAMCKRP